VPRIWELFMTRFNKDSLQEALTFDDVLLVTAFLLSVESITFTVEDTVTTVCNKYQEKKTASFKTRLIEVSL